MFLKTSNSGTKFYKFDAKIDTKVKQESRTSTIFVEWQETASLFKLDCISWKRFVCKDFFLTSYEEGFTARRSNEQTRQAQWYISHFWSGRYTYWYWQLPQKPGTVQLHGCRIRKMTLVASSRRLKMEPYETVGSDSQRKSSSVIPISTSSETLIN